MWDIRMFEDTVSDLLSKNAIRGASHLSAGQEAVPVGVMAALGADDLITSTHRGHGHCYARGVVAGANTRDRQEHLNKMLAELCGKESGYCRGRGGSMHIADVAGGNLGATGIVGGNLPIAVGAALASRLLHRQQVVVSFFGDGAVNEGVFHESLNLASIWHLPVVFVCENNQYAMSVPWSYASSVPNAADRAQSYNMPGIVVDGMDVEAVYEAALQAVERARRNGGPVLLEAKTYRWYGHSRSDPRVYRTRDEENQWRQRDPIQLLKAKLLMRGVTAEELDRIEENARAALENAQNFALNQSPDPSPRDLLIDLYAPAVEDNGESERRAKSAVKDGSCRQIAYWQAINEALQEEMSRDETIVLMGEDIGVYGGAYGATRGLVEQFGSDRVRDTPISEAAIAGAAVGAAMNGLRPVMEIMYVDFTPLAMDQLANQGAKNRYMFGGKTSVPLVVRTEGGAGRGIAAQHSQSLEALWTHFPGLYVVMPSTPFDAKGLLKTAIRDNNPIMFIEHKMLYAIKGEVPEGDYTIPLGVADIKRSGDDVTILTYSRMVQKSLEAAQILNESGISVEVVDLRTLKPLDRTTIRKSVEKTGRCVIVSEGYTTSGFAAELMATVVEEAFYALDRPIVRVAAKDVPIPVAEPLERAAIPQTEDIVAAIREVVR
ncbi:MAG: dehydrogenase [Sulfobacillus acidophilus]|uniref:Dehydrogenase n=1 Tax=Sulfobacillus acidophilus TaxID=53633 RepID=A0A2T2WE79_9FIRM|nr:MAG: dehydrogenase [Sulfobacillus acidophilus]